MLQLVRWNTIVADAGARSIALVCLCVRQPMDVAVHETLAYAESYSSDIACSPYGLQTSQIIEVRLMIIAVASVRWSGSICISIASCRDPLFFNFSVMCSLSVSITMH